MVLQREEVMSRIASTKKLSRRKMLELAGLAAASVGVTSCSTPESKDTTKPQGTAGADSGNAAPSARAVETVSGPTANVAITKEYAQAIGRLAYFWAWPMVNSFNRRKAMTSVPEPGYRGGILPNAPQGQIAMLTDYIDPDQRFVACSNQDVAYGMGYGSLDEDPVIMQVPDFGERFWVYAAWDARTDSFANIGKQYGTKPGFYLMVGPNWKGSIPSGVSEVFRSSTELAAFCPRVFLNDTDEDRKAIQPLLNQVLVYPLTQFDGKTKSKDWKKAPSFPAPPNQGAEEIHWVVPEVFFDQLPDVLKRVAPLSGEESLHRLVGSLLEAADKDPALKAALKQMAIGCESELITPLKQWKLNGPPAGNGWYSPTNNAAFGTDYTVRTAVAKSNMYENKWNETKYIFTDFDEHGQQLNGNSLYSLTFPSGQVPPVNGFWSLTLYNDHHFFNPNPLKRYSLGTKNKTLQVGADGSLTLYAGARSPGKEKETNWLPAPTAPFSLYIRAYWPKEEIIKGTWQPPKVVKV
jgi:hypothetical protein